MNSVIAAALLVLATLSPAVVTAAPACSSPRIVTATAAVQGGSGPLRTYDIAITVRNTGSKPQSSSLLQSVAIYQNGSKVGQEGIEPLRASGSQTVHYRLQRAAGARSGSTDLRFTLVETNPHGVSIVNCTTADNTYRLTV